MMRHAFRVVLALGLIGAAMLMGAPASTAQVTGPKVSLSSDTVHVGDVVLVSLSKFDSRQVTIAVCGNLAQRGSSDSAMGSSQGAAIDSTREVTLARIQVEAPPVPCPCIVRVLSSHSDELAAAPINIIDHPTGPIVGVPNQPLVAVTIAAERNSSGLLDGLRTTLGGRTTYSVTVTVQNITTETLAQIQLHGAASGVFGNEVATLDLPPPGPVDAGQTYTTTTNVDLHAPLAGDVSWTVTASGAGPSVTATSSMGTMPWLLYVLFPVFVVCLLFLLGRLIVRAKTNSVDPADGDDDVDDPEDDDPPGPRPEAPSETATPMPVGH